MIMPLRCAILALGAATLPSLASATTFYSSDTTTPGNQATLYAGYSALPTLPPDGITSPTYDISPGTAWASPVGPSSYVSFNPGTGPNGSVVAPNGYYDYKVSLTGLTGPSEIALTVLADDTVSVYLNLLHQILPEAPGPYPHCASSQPNCVTPYTFDFYAAAGNPLLDFEVHQAAGYSTGLDFYGTTVTPEPGSLVLLGTGLLGGAGALVRRFRKA